MGSGMMGNGMTMGGMGITGILIWIFILVLIIGGVYILVKSFSGSKSNTNNNDNPLQILKKRYAKGEISDEEYERLKEKIKND